MNNIQNHQTDLILPQIFPSNGPESIYPLQEPPSQSFPWQTTLNPTHEPDPDPFLIFPPPPPPYGSSFFYRRSQGLQFGYEAATSAATSQYHDGFRILSEDLGPMVQNGLGSGPFMNGLQGEFGRLTTAQDILDAKALAASKSHSEAERRRRERINNHLAKLRTLLPNTTKTDKASLLAEVIQQVKELKRQTSVILETNPTIPTETNELTVEEDGEFVVKATFCCEDRSDILPELIKTLKTLQLKTLKAEIMTVGCRVKNVLFIAGDGEGHSVNSIREALKAVMEKNGCGEEKFSSGNAKRQRTNSINILEQQNLI